MCPRPEIKVGESQLLNTGRTTNRARPHRDKDLSLGER